MLQSLGAAESLKIRLVLEDEQPVGRIQRGRCHLIPKVRKLVCEGCCHEHYNPQQQQPQSRQQTPRTPRPEPAQRNRAFAAVAAAFASPVKLAFRKAAFVFAEQQRCDEIAAHHEKHLHPQEPARHPREIKVIQHHHGNRNRSDAVKPGYARQRSMPLRGRSVPLGAEFPRQGEKTGAAARQEKEAVAAARQAPSTGFEPVTLDLGGPCSVP